MVAVSKFPANCLYHREPLVTFVTPGVLAEGFVVGTHRVRCPPIRERGEGNFCKLNEEIPAIFLFGAIRLLARGAGTISTVGLVDHV